MLFPLILLLPCLASATHWRPPQRGGWGAVSGRSGEELYPGVYLGEGRASWNPGYAELSCSLNQFQGYVVSNVVWTKMRGNYEEPFYPCPQCYPQEDPRVRAFDHQGKSLLLVRDPGPGDRGVYRCTATAQGYDGRLATIYQVVSLL